MTRGGAPGRARRSRARRGAAPQLRAAVREAQAARERTQRLLDEIANGSTDVIFAKNLEGRYLLLNREGERITGYSAALVLGRDDKALFDSQGDMALVRANDLRVMRENRVTTVEEAFESPLGLRVLQITKGPLRDAAGRVIGMFGIGRDITEHKRVEDDLRRMQAQLTTFIQTAPLSIAMFDRDMRTLAYSERWLADYGRGHADLTGLSHYVVHPDLPDRWREVHRRALAGETIRQDEDMWIQADGSPHWLRWAVVPWKDARGAIGGIIVSSEDVTEAKLARDAAREREARYRAAVETTLDGFWMVGADGRLLDVNASYARRSGYAREQLLTMRVSDLDASDSPQDVAARIAGVLAGSDARFETVHRSRDGELWPVEIVATRAPPQRGEGQARWFAFLRDVTERKRLLQRIIDVGTAEQERIGREIHDGIAQQLTALGMLAAGLQRRLGNRALDDEARALGDIAQGMNRALGEARFLARGLLPVQVDAAGLPDALALLVAEARAASGNDCRFVARGELPLLDTITAVHLYRIAQEALTNALRHARATRIDMVLQCDGGRVELAVTDDGVGLDRARASAGRLGMSIMYDRARIIGATLLVEPAVPRGTRVLCVCGADAVPAEAA